MQQWALNSISKIRAEEERKIKEVIKKLNTINIPENGDSKGKSGNYGVDDGTNPVSKEKIEECHESLSSVFDKIERELDEKGMLKKGSSFKSMEKRLHDWHEKNNKDDVKWKK